MKIDERRGESPLANFMMRKQPWVKGSMCLRPMTIPVIGMQVPVPPDTFFPNDATYEAARSICRMCPVRTQCGTDAIEEEMGKSITMRSGMRGGVTPGQRIKIEERGGVLGRDPMRLVKRGDDE